MPMSIHQIINDTLNLTDEAVMDMIGAGDLDGVVARREKMRKFLTSHKWSLEGYKAWVKDGSWTPDQPVRGMGDRIAKVTHAMGIKGCVPCGRRQRGLNNVLPKRQRSSL